MVLGVFFSISGLIGTLVYYTSGQAVSRLFLAENIVSELQDSYKWNITIVGIFLLFITLLALIFIRKWITVNFDRLVHFASIVGTGAGTGQKDAPLIKGHISEFNLLGDVIEAMVERLQESEENWGHTFNAIDDMVIIANTDLEIIKTNKAARRFLEENGHDTQTVPPSKTSKGIFCFTKTALSNSPAALTLQDKMPHFSEVDGPNPQQTLLVSSSPIFNKEQELKGVVIYAKDISAQKAMEFRLAQSQKIEAIGTLAGGIAHDFNNLLTPIMGYISLAIHESEQNDNVSSYLQEALGSADHARHLIQQILAFTRNTGPAEEVVHVASLAQEAMRLLRASIPTTIKIIEEIDPDSGSVLADSTQIHQILINLGTNAYHAIGTTGGTIRLKIEDEPQDKEAGEDHAGTQAYLRIEVSDTGHGIDPEIRERIFDPYFTTKIKQGGTGLGLSMVHNIVKNFGGKISVESDPQTGTKFIILLPRIPESERPTKEDVNETLLPGTENIWVVDDDEMVLLMETRLLKELGYQVKGFLDSTEALNYFTAHTSEVDVLITDLTMPVMTGETLAQKVQAIRPELPIILCSGNSERINQEIAENIQIARFVQKPFMPAYLAQIIRDVLSSKEGQNEAIK